MKKFFCLCFIIAVIMLALPLSVLGKETPKTAFEKDQKGEETQTVSENIFRVYDPKTDKIINMTANDYIFCVVAAEMPALYEEEALKAQAVAAYTFALSRKTANVGKDYDITTDYNTDQSFKTKEQALADWGEKGQEYAAKIEKAVKAVEGMALTYGGEIITAAYHAVSAGKTQNSRDVWGKERPYLKSVLSEGDKLNKNYKSVATFTESELKERLKSIDINGDSIVFENLEKTEAGYIKSVTVCEKETTGAKIREALSLKSTCFEIEKSDDNYIFTVYGYGHGVGMSQAGADYMAKQGADYKEILLHFYTDCKIEKV